MPTTWSLLKSHAITMGDCVAVFDPEFDSLLEFTLCLEELVGVNAQSQQVRRAWFEQLDDVNLAEFNRLFTFTKEADVQELEYVITDEYHKQHTIRHLSYCYANDLGEQLILIILRDFSTKSKKQSTLKVADWHHLDSSQIRHLRKIIKALYIDLSADFLMVATPDLDNEAATSLVAMQDGLFIEPLNYALAGTPCELTSSGKICVHKEDIQTLYASDDFLKEMGAQSYIGVPFFNEKGRVHGYLVVINKYVIEDEESFHRIIHKYQPMLNRRIQLFIADQQLQGFKRDRFEHSQLLLGSTPTSENLMAEPTLSNHAFNDLKEAILIADANLTIIQVNKAFSDITGYSAKEAVGQKPNMLSSGKHQESFYQEMYQSLEQDGIWEGEIVNKTKQGRLYTEWLNIRVIYNHHQELTHYMAIFSDISFHKEHEALLYFQANYDPLTSFPNRSLLFYQLAEQIEQLTTQSRSTLCLLHLDLNGLSRINENYGYAIGDALLLHVAEIIKSHVDENTIIARISGDNFIILRHILDEELSEFTLTDTLIESIAAPIDIEGVRLNITSNIGIAYTKNPELSTDNFYSRAEQALFRAKLDGVNLARVYDKVLENELKNCWQLEQELNLAIEKDQFELYYQPQMDVITNRLAGVEALVRWHHPTRGLLTPGYFIPLAEKTGQIIPLGNLILQKACAQIRCWQQQLVKRFTVSVNISPKQFSVEATHHYLKRIINEAQIDKSLIVLEITEDVLMTEHSDLLEMLKDFRQDGIELSLDDFGTGFSSLSYLQQYPLNELKIDRSFIRTLGAKPESQTIVKAIIAMAKGLKLKVVAEGVETLQHRDVLSKLGCDILQGYYYAKPLCIEKLKPFIK